MKLQEKIESILKHIRTAEEREEIRVALAVLREGRYYDTAGFDVSKALLKKVRQQIVSAFQDTILSDEYRNDRIAAENFLSALEQSINAMRPLVLTIAVDPDEKIVESTASWIAQEVGKDIYIVFERDRHILGGARLAFLGRYKDFSLLRRVRSFLDSKKNDIKSILDPSFNDEISHSKPV